MRDYAKVSPKFWTGRTGKALKAAGPEAVIVGMYLMTSPHANMIGVYHCPIAYIAIDTGLTIEGASKGLTRAIDAGFCTIYADTDFVFVHEFAAYQVGLQLEPKDKRRAGVRNELKKVPDGQCRRDFEARYAVPFRLIEVDESAASCEAPSMPLACQEQEQEQEQEQGRWQGREHEHEPESPARPPTGALNEMSTGSLASASLQKPPKKTRLPAGFTVSQSVKMWADSKGFAEDLPAHLEYFTGYVKANAKTYADWDQAFQNAIRGDWGEVRKRASARRAGSGASDDDKPAWALEAGFANRFEAENEGCSARNASEFSGGKRTGVPA